MGEWREVPLVELAEPYGLQTGPFGSQLHAEEYSDDGVPVVMPQDLSDHGIDTANIARVPDSVTDRLRQHKLLPGDLVLARRGDLRRRALVGTGQAGWLCGTGCLRARLSSSVDPRFVFYAFACPSVAGWIERHAVGATMPNLNTTILGSTPVPLPPLPEQRAIADVLGTLDDKIESNRRVRNAQAEVLTAAFSRSVHGVTERTPLSTLARLHKQSTHPSEWPARVFEQFSIPAYDADAGPEVCEGATMASSKTTMDDGLVLVSKLNPATKRVWWPERLGVGEPVCSPEFVALAASHTLPTWIYGCVAFDGQYYDELLGAVSGTTGSRQRVKPGDVIEATVPAVSPETIESWDDFASPVLAQRVSLLRESRTLTAIRDALLPKLVSGQIRVPLSDDVEEQVGHATEALPADA